MDRFTKIAIALVATLALAATGAGLAAAQTSDGSTPTPGVTESATPAASDDAATAVPDSGSEGGSESDKDATTMPDDGSGTTRKKCPKEDGAGESTDPSTPSTTTITSSLA